MTRLLRAVMALSTLCALAWLGACSDNPSGPGSQEVVPPLEPERLVVSDPAPAAGSGLAPASATARSLAGSTGDDVVYVSVRPGTISSGTRAVVRRVGSTESLQPLLFDGGFDPVPVPAQVGDSIAVVVTDDQGTFVEELGLVVLAVRPPVVVRTQPPRRKTDVPVNAAIVIVFSEPVDGATLSTESIRLLLGTTPVAGAVRFLDATFGATQLSAEFVPDVPLAATSEYQLVVTRQVRDLDGEILAAADTVPFTTAESSTGPPASISLSVVDSVMSLVIGSTFQMTATVRDAEGTMLTDHPVEWSSSDPTIVTVSTTGLLTALELGFARVTASVDGLSQGIWVYVLAGPPASVAITPTEATVPAGDTILLTATVRDGDGRVIDNPQVTWTSNATSVATVEWAGAGIGRVIGVSEGEAMITATSETVSGSAVVTVGPPVPVASVTITPDSLTLVAQGAVYLGATLRDADGRDLSERPITWTSDNTAVATVDADGLVTGVSEGSAGVIATSEGVSDTAAITVTRVEYVAVSAGGNTCGLTSAGAAYCWGSEGSLGIGPLQVPYCPNSAGDCSPVPVVAVAGGFTFAGLGAGARPCGIAPDGTAYCWGTNLEAWGDGRTFSAVSAGIWDTCGLTLTGAVYCLGLFSGGDVPGGLTFSAVSVLGEHKCGLATGEAAYCWGYNAYGQLGDGSTTSSSTPVLVTGGLIFSVLSAGAYHTCGITTSGTAYCWGANASGELGIGTTTGPETCSFGGEAGGCSSAPVLVTGGLTFTSLSAGRGFTCGIASGGAAYCWGGNRHGQLGDGSTNSSSTPVAVTGALTFAALSAATSHACGITTGGVTYCWGENSYGKLGNGSETNSSVPIRVAGQP